MAGAPRRLATVFVAALAAASCYARPLLTPLQPEPGTVSNFTLGLARVAAAGQVMLERTEGSAVLPGFVLDKPITVKGLRSPQASSAWKSRFEYKGTCPSGRYVLTAPAFYNERLGIIVGEDGTIDCPHPVIQLRGAKMGRSWDL